VRAGIEPQRQFPCILPAFLPRLLVSVVVALEVASPFILFAQVPPPGQVTLILPEHTQFQPLLRDKFPHFLEAESYANLRPFLVLLRNDTSRHVLAYVIKWDVRFSHRLPGVLQNYYIQEPLSIARPQAPLSAAQRSSFSPGELRLLSPFFNVDATQYVSSHGGLAKTISTFLTLEPYSSIEIQTVTATLDAVIYADGTFEGPDHFRLLSRYQCLRQAERDLGTELMNLIQAGAPTHKILTLLQDKTHPDLPTDPPVPGSDYACAIHTAKVAQFLLVSYSRGGMHALKMQASLAANLRGVVDSTRQRP
jgi:hypothetical protein